MNTKTLFLAIITACAIFYVFFYLYKRTYLKEYFENSVLNKVVINNGSGPVQTTTDVTRDYHYTARSTDPGIATANAERTQSDDTTYNANQAITLEPTNTDIQMTTVEAPYAQDTIDDLGDYESDMVYENESNTALSKDLRQKLMSQYPMHWSSHPPSSSQFQAGLQESFQNASQNVPDDAKPYQNISGSTMAPPDRGILEQEERKILQTYKPEFPPRGATYGSENPGALIKKVYDAKGLIPDVKHHEASNVYEIVGTRRKNEKVVYEDEEAGATRGANAHSGEGLIGVPSAVSESGSNGNPWKYTAWTPGLEQMFAPTEPRRNWTT